MKNTSKEYWKGLEQLSNDVDFVKYADKEFPEYVPVKEQNNADEGGNSRRDFLKLMGFSVAAASLAACEAPVRKAIPYLNKPVEVDPGIPNYYASTYINGGDVSSIVVKTREGRPIKIEGNRESSINRGGVNAQMEASVLNLYDTERLRKPAEGGKDTTWESLDQKVIAELGAIAGAGGQIRIVSRTVASPTTQKAIDAFKAKYPNTQHIQYDPASAHGIIAANNETFGRAGVPVYDFSKAEVIVSFAADFLGTWLSPVEYTKQYSKGRKINAAHRAMSRHYQFEANLSLTGANADYRVPVRPSQEGLIVGALYNAIAAKAGQGTIGTTAVANVPFIEKAANELWAARGKSLVVAGSNDTNVQKVVNGINYLLGNYGQTLHLDKLANIRRGNDTAITGFARELAAGRIPGVIFFDCNPVYDHFAGTTIAEGLPKAQLSVSTSTTQDETAAICKFIAPNNHYLESWNDAEPHTGHLSLGQPTISPLFDTRQAQSSFLTWAQEADTDYLAFLQENWKVNY